MTAIGEGETEGMWWVRAIVLPVAWFGVVQFIETYILTPKIAGKATNLDPVTIVVAVLAGGALLGVYGMLLAIPIAACGKILLLEVLFPKVDAWLKGERPDPLPIERGD
jgi:predicted PurR-regulated permease PerM